MPAAPRSIIVAAIAIAFAAPASAAVRLVDFDNLVYTDEDEGFFDADAPELRFFSTKLASPLIPQDLDVQTNGIGLVVLDDDDGDFLIGRFSVGVSSLSLAFGNDDPRYSSPGDLAALTVFLGTTQVGFTTVVMNRDDILNQRIGFSGAIFDSFTFAFTTPGGSLFLTGSEGSGLVEVVDDIAFTTVPEPATWALMVGGFGLVGMVARRRRALAAS